MRRPLVAGNWKMNKTTGDAVALTSGLITELAGFTGADALLCPPFTALAAVGETLRSQGSAIALGAQDLFIQDSGAFTGMVAPGMLTDLGCTYVIVGHSERRGRFGTIEDWMTPEVLALFGDSDATVNAKAKKALAAGMTPIICFGETIGERKAGQTDTVCEAQVRAALAGIDNATIGQLVLAYEPVWAIGTGETCDAPEANRVCGLARSVVASVAGQAAADGIRIQYGGSVKPDNAAELLGQEHIDGALVGGASLKVDSFAAIVRAAR
ncbi:MAG TPA: triose-phosphate isomerase [Armatimonadota bacterium]|nr:triose-phosphate isomerase [Armatimonadota bacterium]